ncbi:hypothetical protein, partial [Pedobacter jejuensis]|uniref:hypothetical protein n=1 Tax=Pedobacter jejuensis TaxID=1268550 RepID=UPI001ABF6305
TEKFRGSIWIGAKGSFSFGEPYQINSAKGNFLDWRRGVNLKRFIQTKDFFGCNSVKKRKLN